MSPAEEDGVIVTLGAIVAIYVICWTFMYVLAAFVAADWNWIGDIWHWTGMDRAFFAFFAIVPPGFISSFLFMEPKKP